MDTEFPGKLSFKWKWSYRCVADSSLVKEKYALTASFFCYLLLTSPLLSTYWHWHISVYRTQPNKMAFINSCDSELLLTFSWFFLLALVRCLVTTRRGVMVIIYFLNRWLYMKGYVLEVKCPQVKRNQSVEQKQRNIGVGFAHTVFWERDKTELNFFCYSKKNFRITCGIFKAFFYFKLKTFSA